MTRRASTTLWNSKASQGKPLPDVQPEGRQALERALQERAEELARKRTTKKRADVSTLDECLGVTIR